MARRRVVVVGADAAGMSAASTLKRRAGDSVDVLAFERTAWTSYSACGIPYWLAGDVDAPEDLVARTAHEHRDRGIDVRLHSEVVSLDPDAATVEVVGNGRTETFGYDDLVLATGAEPQRPDVPGIDAHGVYGVQSLDDGTRILDALSERPRTAVVVGSGYIGLEMAEACVRRGIATTVVDQAEAPMTTIDLELGRYVEKAMTGMGIDVVLGTGLREVVVRDGRVRAVETDAGTYDADLVILGTGVRARSDLARDAGLTLGAKDAVSVDSRQRADPGRHIWAVGDCVETYDRVRRSRVHVPLGTHANKQGLVLGLNLAGEDAEFPGIVGTAMTKVCDVEIARTGLGEHEAADAGFDAVAATIETTTKAGYLPGANPMTVKMIGDRAARRVLGAQIVGREGSALRIDTVAMALWTEMTADALVMTDLGYAPPFSSVWDPVQVAARALVGAME